MRDSQKRKHLNYEGFLIRKRRNAEERKEREMNSLINDSVSSLGAPGRGFCDYAGSMFVRSGLLIILLLIVDLLIRKHVKATLRYWIWMLVFVKLILPPSLSLPTGLGYWRGEILPAGPPISQQGPTIIQ